MIRRPGCNGSFRTAGRKGRWMTNCMSHSGNSYESILWFDSSARPGVRCGIVRVSFGRRIELARRIRDVGRKAEYLDAGGEVKDKLEAAVVAAEIDRAYLDWG